MIVTQLLASGRRPNTAAAPTPASAAETVTILIASTWLTAGLFIDGYAHEHLLTGQESFLTPWHAVFYSGYVATVLAVARLARRRLGAGPRLRDCLPAAYRPSALGAGVFAFGGIGDAAWHTRYGFEHGTEALYSPTHLVLLLGLVLVVTGPLRAAIDGPSPAIVTWRQFMLPFVSLTLAVSIVAFFAPWGLYQPDWYRVAYVASTGAGESELNAALGAELSTSLILIGAMLLLVRRWRTPLGTFALLFGATATLFNLVFDGTMLAILAAVVGGACADVVLVRQRDDITGDGRARTLAAAALSAFSMMSTWHLLLYLDGDLEWPAPLAAGTPVLAALACLALAGLAAPATLAATDQLP
jgi:hypothetical protein